MSERVRVLVGGLRGWLRSLPEPMAVCDRCRLANVGRADRTVCLHRAEA